MSFVQSQKLHMLFSGVVGEKNENVEQMQWEQRWKYVVCFCTDRAVIWTISVTDLLNMQIGTLNQGLQMYSGKSRDLNWNPVIPICSVCEKSNKVWVIGHVHTECVFTFLYASFPLRVYVNTLDRCVSPLRLCRGAQVKVSSTYRKRIFNIFLHSTACISCFSKQKPVLCERPRGAQFWFIA